MSTRPARSPPRRCFDVGRYQAQVAQDKDALELLVGAPVADDKLPGGIDDEVMVLGALPAGVSSAVLLQRPDVVEAEDQLKAANADIGAARAAFFPQITLTGAGGFISRRSRASSAAGSQTWSFVPQLTQPLFDAGKNRAGLAQAKGQRDLAQAKYEKAIQTAFREVADAARPARPDRRGAGRPGGAGRRRRRRGAAQPGAIPPRLGLLPRCAYRPAHALCGAADAGHDAAREGHQSRHPLPDSRRGALGPGPQSARRTI